MKDMKDYTIFVETNNPDFLDRVKRALNEVGLDLDNEGNPHYLEFEVCNPVPADACYSDYVIAGWVYDPE